MTHHRSDLGAQPGRATLVTLQNTRKLFPERATTALRRAHQTPHAHPHHYRPVGFHNPVTDSEQGRLRGSFVLVDQPAEDWATSDPLVGQVDDGPVGSWRLPLQRPVWSSVVVVTGIFIERQA